MKIAVPVHRVLQLAVAVVLISGCSRAEFDRDSESASLSSVSTDDGTGAAELFSEPESDEPITELQRAHLLQIEADSETVLRSRVVQVNLPSVTSDDLVASGLKTGTARRIRLNLFGDEELSMIVDSVETLGFDNEIIRGRIDGDADSDVSFVRHGDALVGDVRLRGGRRSYEVRYAGDGVHTVTELNPDAKVPDCSPMADGSFAQSLDETETKKATRGSNLAGLTVSALDTAPVAALETSANVDVLVAFTPQALANQGGESGMLALIQLAISNSNKAYVDSGVAHRLRLVGTIQVAANGSGDAGSDLQSLTNKGDGLFDEVHAARQTSGADIVALLIGSTASGTIGTAWVDSRASSGFSVSKASFVNRYHVFTHEVGHNLSLGHTEEAIAGGKSIMAASASSSTRLLFTPTHATQLNSKMPQKAILVSEVSPQPTPVPTPTPTPSPTPRPTATPTPTPVPTPTPPPVTSAVRFVLYNADTDQEVKTLANGSILSIPQDGTNLAIRAVTADGVSSVRFDLRRLNSMSRASSVRDRTAPFTVHGDSVRADGSVNYAGWSPRSGEYVLTASPSGGSSVRIQFRVQR